MSLCLEILGVLMDGKKNRIKISNLIFNPSTQFLEETVIIT